MRNAADTAARNAPARVLVLACGALAKEIMHLVRLNGWDHVTLECLPAIYHNTPDKITPAIAARLSEARDQFDRILLGYADCGTGGHLDALIEGMDDVQRLPGAHCYEFFATSPVFAELHEAELGTFYLTDFLVKHFDRFVVDFLGLDRHPELRDMYFGNYKRLVYLSQIDDADLVAAAEACAVRLDLEFQHVAVGYGDLATSMGTFAVAG